jgi:hypothetical protein
MIVSGTGNVKDVTLAPEGLENRFKVYPDQPESKQSVQGNKIAGEKTFKFALVPLKPGKTSIPPITLSYFDPSENQYVTAQTQPLTLSALPSSTENRLNLVESEVEKEESGSNTIKILGKDILPIHSRLGDFENHSRSDWNQTLILAELLFPAILFLGVSWVARHNLRLKSDPAYYRSRAAFNIASRQLDSISSQTDSKDLAQQLSQVLREYIGNKLNLSGKAFTSTELEMKMKERHYNEELATSTRKLLEKYESLQYTSAALESQVGLLQEASEHLKRLEKKY